MKYDDDWKWEFRIIKSLEEYNNPDDKLSIQECLIDEDGVMVSHTIDFIVEGGTFDEMKLILKEMTKSFNKPILPAFAGVDDVSQNP
tara:strand:- start:458 stop:718 length:261 start_codon:yes stop_codon:yes gene_type:complete